MYSDLVKNIVEKLNETELLLTQGQDSRVEILGICHLEDLEGFILGLKIFNDLQCSDSTLHLINNYVEVRLRNPGAAISTSLLRWHPVLVELDLHNLNDLSSMLEGIWDAMDYKNVH